MGQNLVVYVHNNYIYIFSLVKLVPQSCQGSSTKKSRCTTAVWLEWHTICRIEQCIQYIAFKTLCL